MNLNPKKCQILSENQNDLIVEEEENITLYSKLQTKYLGQIINSRGEPMEIIKMRELKRNSSIINNTTPILSRRTRIKYIKLI